MKSLKVILGVLCFILPFSFALWQTNGNAVVNGSEAADSHVPIVFGQLTAADTTESVKVLAGLHKEITYFIKVTSRHQSGLMVNDTVYVKLCISADDSTYVNASSINETKTYTSLGTSSITFDYLSSVRYTRIEIPRMTDSLTVNVKAVISTNER